jgi:hypothetical protein
MTVIFPQIRMKKIICCIGLLWYSISAIAQRLPVNVSLFTGTAGVTIPIETIVEGNISVPIGITYASNGTKLRDGEGTAGLGWSLIAGGQISRTVRGLPDDIKKNMIMDNRTGWLYNTNRGAINAFSIANTTNPVNCTNAQTDINYINSNCNNNSDTEPDLFQISAPGLSCQFVFDNNNTILTIPYQDVVIVPTYDAPTGLITSFTVTNNKGIRYAFTVATAATRRTTTQAGPGAKYWDESNIKYFQAAYYQSKGGIQFYSSWLLTGIIDANGNSVGFSYDDMGVSTTRTQVDLYEGGAARQPLYVINETQEVKPLSSISSSKGVVEFTYGVYNNNVKEGTLINTIKARGITYIFNYANLLFNTNQASFRNSCLRSVTTDQCESPFNYFLEYEGESTNPGTSQYTERDSAYKFTDVWGYYTGIKSNTIAAVNASTVNTGTLKKIKYYDNGTTTLEYESNTYYDPTIGSVVNGGGVRIKTITDYDGISTGSNIVRNYSYTNPSSSLSSGVPVSLPQISFIRPVASPTLTNSTVKSDNDLSEEDHTIMYAFAKESQTGKGSTQYEYTVPAGAWDTSSPYGDWAPTLSSAGVSGCSPSLGLLANASRTYPFAPNTNYDFERGMLTKETNYNDAGSKVAEVTYSYYRSFAPVAVNAFRFDAADYARVYSKYNIYTTTSELLVQTDKTLYDPSSTTTGLHTREEFSYGSYYKQLAHTESTNSDGSVTRTHIISSKDYNSTTGDIYTTALTARNINVPIETYTETKAPGGSTFKVTGGQLIQYGSFAAETPRPNNILPATIKSFVAPIGISSFTPTTSSSIATADAHYALNTTITDYYKYGAVRSATGMNQRPQTIINSDDGTKLPLAVFDNAQPSQVVYGINQNVGAVSDKFTPTSTLTGVTAIVGRSGIYTGLSFTSSNTFNKFLLKTPQAANYTFSVWIKSASAGSFNVTASSPSATQTVALAYQASTNWKYYQINIPLTGMAPGAFSLSFTVGSGINIDGDVMAYPQQATVATNAYNTSSGNQYPYKIMETNNNGISTYYDRDKLGRVIYTYDQDKQIVSKNTYKYNSASIIPQALFYIDVPVGDKDIYTDVNYAFRLYNSFETCLLQGATYSWNYGDGSAATSANTHTFTHPGSYNVTLSVTIPGVGTTSTTIPFVVAIHPPPPVYLFYINNTPYNNDAGTYEYALDHLEFMQGGVVVQTVYVGDIFGSNVPPGAYTVKVYCTGTDSGKSVVVDVDESISTCKNGSHTNVYSFSINATSRLDITINPSTCP